jgi:Family of unknown function (DUF6498)
MGRFAGLLATLLELVPALSPGGRLSASLLIVANAIPLLCVLFARWDLRSLLTLYWLEIGVIGAFNALKVARCRPREGHERLDGLPAVAVPMFVVIYFPIWLLYGAALDMIGIDVFDTTARMDAGLDWSFAFLCLTHAVAYFTSFSVPARFRGRTPVQQLKEPLPRLMGTQACLVIGGMLSRLFGTPFGMLVVLTGLKTLLDLTTIEAEDAFIEPQS